MPSTEHLLERRASLLAGKITSLKSTLVQSLAPPGQRPPFTAQMSRPEVLAWWQQHYSDDLGAKVRAQMTPESQQELTLALSQANERAMWGGGTDEQP